jgi:hypothetical protein
VSIDDRGQLGCGVAIGTSYRGHGQVEPVGWYCNTHPPAGYVQWPVAWQQWMAKDHPNVVVYLGGRWEVEDRTYEGHWTNILDPAYAAYVKSQLVEAVQVATSGGARMIMMTAPCYSSGEQGDGAPWPEDSPARLERYNSLVREVASEFPSKVTLQDLDAGVCPGGKFVQDIDGVQVRAADGVHFTFDNSDPSGAAMKAAGTVLDPMILPLWARVGREQIAARGAPAAQPPAKGPRVAAH